MSEELDEMDEYENDSSYCARCEAKLFDPYDEDAPDEVWDDPEYGIRGDSPYSDLCQGCASVHIRDDERFEERSSN